MTDTKSLQLTSPLLTPATLDVVIAAVLQNQRELQNTPTPASVLKVRPDGFPYPEFAYMLALMNKHHPLRQELIDFTENIPAGVIVAVARVADLITGEVRTGVDAHRITFKKGALPSAASVIDLGNDYKSAQREALRKAYSEYEVCADMYRRLIRELPTEEQKAEFDVYDRYFTEYLESNIEPKLDEWWDRTREAWKQHTRQSASQFLQSLATHVERHKQKREKTPDA